MPAGGYQKPAAPAPVSGPGSMSRRTDGGPGQPIRDPGGLPYGDNAELRSQQAAAPMSGQSPQAAAAAARPSVSLAEMSPSLFDPTDAPDEPVTSGMPFGPGPDGGAEGLVNAGPTQERIRASLPVLLRMAESPYVSREFRAMVNYVRSTVNG